MKKLIALFVLFFGFSATAACTPAAASYDIYATVYPLVFVANKIAYGTGLTVGMVPGISSHQSTADWSPKEIIGMTDAALILYVGANLDAYIDNQIEGVFEEQYLAGRLVKMENEIDFIEGIVHHHDEDGEETTTTETRETTLGYDPHFWVSPERMIEVAAVVCAKMSWAYPDLAVEFAANHSDLLAELEALSLRYAAAIDVGTKVMMTSTNLYGYLEADYGLEIISISPGYHEETEQFTAQQKLAIVEDAIFHGIRYIVYEKNASSPLSEAVLQALNDAGLPYLVDKVDFNIMDTVPSPDTNYIQIMDLNLQSIVKATEIVTED